jgi:hypothetical protein
MLKRLREKLSRGGDKYISDEEDELLDEDYVNTVNRTKIKPEADELSQVSKRKRGGSSSSGAVLPFNGSADEENIKPDVNVNGTHYSDEASSSSSFSVKDHVDFPLKSVFRLGPDKTNKTQSTSATPIMMDNPMLNLNMKHRVEPGSEPVRIRSIVRGGAGAGAGGGGLKRRRSIGDLREEMDEEEHKSDDRDCDQIKKHRNHNETLNDALFGNSGSTTSTTSEVKSKVDDRFASSRSVNSKVGIPRDPHSTHNNPHSHSSSGGGGGGRLVDNTPVKHKQRGMRGAETASGTPLRRTSRGVPGTPGFVGYKRYDAEEATELFSKVRHNHPDAVERILVNGCDPDTRDEYGNTMLHIAAQNNLKRMAEMLIGFGASMSMLNKKGMTPLDYSIQYKFVALERYLSSEGAEASNIKSGGRTNNAPR